MDQGYAKMLLVERKSAFYRAREHWRAFFLAECKGEWQAHRAAHSVLRNVMARHATNGGEAPFCHANLPGTINANSSANATFGPALQEVQESLTDQNQNQNCFSI